MVNTGQPSDGCFKCRERRVKCDSLRPSCERCCKYGVECPGYPEMKGLVFRNETLLVQQKANEKYGKRKRHTASKGTTSSVMGHTPLNQRPLSRSGSSTAEIKPSLLNRTALVPQPDSGTLIEGAVATFLSQWDNPNVDIFWGLFDPVAKEPPIPRRNWGLGCAMNAVSLMALALRPEMETVDLRGPANAMYGKTLLYINTALRYPAEVIDDETLLTVTLIALFERMYDMWDMPMPPALTHIRGLMSMINVRGPEQFHSPMARKIFLFAYFSWTTTAMPELAVTPHLAQTYLPPLSDEVFYVLHNTSIFGHDPAFRLIPIVQRSLHLRAMSIPAIQTATISNMSSLYLILAAIRSVDSELWNWNRTLFPTDPNWGEEDRLYQMLLTSWYRTHRVFLADLAIICHQRLAELENLSHDLAIWEHTDLAQNAVDEICARIPYDFDIDNPRQRKPHVKTRVVPEAKITYLYHASFEYPLLVCSMVWTLPQARQERINAARRECARNCGLQRPLRTLPKVLIYLPAEQRDGWVRYKQSFRNRLEAADTERQIAATSWVQRRQEARPS